MTTIIEKPPVNQDVGKYHIMTWGCQMNEEDSEQMSLFLEQMGYSETDEPDSADIVLLNTCSVRSKPEEKVWSVLGRLRDIKAERPDMILGVCGCMAQVESSEIRKRAPYVDIVMGTGNLGSLPDLVNAAKAGNQIDPPSSRQKTRRNFVPLTSLALPERKGAIVCELPERANGRKKKLKAHVPIMYGCDKFCTFCIVPFTRGRERSRPTEDILNEITSLSKCGVREITLLGQTVNSYGKNMPEGKVTFTELLYQIDAIPGIERLRFTSPYPRDFTDELIIALSKLKSVCEHIHLPLQVGDDALLKDMHRGYTVDEYKQIYYKLRQAIPNVSITTDLMLGYPGETHEQFMNTMNLVEELRFDAAFMFAYSPRPNTKAALREDQIPREVKMERLNALIALQNAITCEMNAASVGRIEEVMVESLSHKEGAKLSGYTRTLKMVHFGIPEDYNEPAESLIGQFLPVRLEEAHLTGFSGSYVPGDTLTPKSV